MLFPISLLAVAVAIARTLATLAVSKMYSLTITGSAAVCAKGSSPCWWNHLPQAARNMHNATNATLTESPPTDGAKACFGSAIWWAPFTLIASGQPAPRAGT